jgi:D-inositol-3-phosphate glycosyltransferase
VRVLLVSTYFDPHVGGVEVVAAHQAAVLARGGHEVTVATSRWDRTLPEYEDRDGYRVCRLPATNAVERRTGIPYPFISPGHARGLWHLVRAADVVHVHDVLYQPPQVAAVLAGWAGRPLYATQHVGPVNHPHPAVRMVERTSTALAGRYIWSRARRVVSYNPMVAAHLRTHGVPEHRIVGATIGVDLTRYRPGRSPDSARIRAGFGLPPQVPLVLFVGRMVAKKGYQHLIEAAGNGYHIVLAGPGHPDGELPPGVSFIGTVQHDRLVELYRSADLFVLPSTGEVFPIAAQEAMACGLPVVLTDAPGYTVYGVDRDLLPLVPQDSQVLKAVIEDVLVRPDHRMRMGAYARQLAETFFDAAATEKLLVDLYEDVDDAAKEAVG